MAVPIILIPMQEPSEYSLLLSYTPDMILTIKFVLAAYLTMLYILVVRKFVQRSRRRTGSHAVFVISVHTKPRVFSLIFHTKFN